MPENSATAEQPATIAIHYESYGDQWAQMLRERLPGFELRMWPDWGNLDEIDYAVVWKPPHGLLQQCAGLKAVFSIGAGVDQLLVDPLFPRHIPLIRMIDEGLADGMAEYITLAVLALHRDLPRYTDLQRQVSWQPLVQRHARDQKVGILGIGKLGLAVAVALAPFGFQIAGWSHSKKQLTGIECHAGMDELPGFLSALDFLVVLLPLTDATRNLLDATTLAMLPKGASVINAARGPILDIEAAKGLLDQGHLGYLWLDVHHAEPLPAEHWTWQHDRLIVTPHIAAATLPATASGIVADGILRMQQGKVPANVVDFDKSY